MKLIAIVGMPGSGKTEAAKFFEEKGFARLRFGDVTIEELEKRGLEVNEKNEKDVREDLRNRHGMDAYAKFIAPKIEKNKGEDIVLDGMKSAEEHEYLKGRYPNMAVVAIDADTELRHKRLVSRKERPLTKEEASSRDLSEIQKLNAAGPIENADYIVANNGSIKELRKKLEGVLSDI